MKCNVGGADRTMRFLSGAALVGAGLFVEMEKEIRIAAFLGGAIALITAALRYCPANAMIGVNTCHKAA